MPNIDDLKQFNQKLIQTGDEERIKADRGEEIETPEPPTPEQAQQLLSRNRLRVRKSSTSNDTEGSEDKPKAKSGDDTPGTDDFLSSTLGLDTNDEGGSPDFNFDDIFGDDDSSGGDEEEFDLDSLDLSGGTTDAGDASDTAHTPDAGEDDEQALLDDFLNDFGNNLDEEVTEEEAGEAAEEENIEDAEEEAGNEPQDAIDASAEDDQFPADESSSEATPEETGFADDFPSNLFDEEDSPAELGDILEQEPTSFDSPEEVSEGSLESGEEEFPDIDFDEPEDFGFGEDLPQDLDEPADLDKPADLDEPVDQEEPVDLDEPAELDEHLDLDEQPDFADLEEPVDLDESTDLADLEEPVDLDEPDDLSPDDFDEGVFGEDEFSDFSLPEVEDDAPAGEAAQTDDSGISDLEGLNFSDEELSEADFGSTEGSLDEFSDDFGADLSQEPDFSQTAGEESGDDSFAVEGEEQPPDFDEAFGAEGFGGDEEFSDEFSMGDFGAEFGILDDEQALLGEDEVSVPGEKPLPDEELGQATASDEAQGFGISEEEFGKLKGTLAGLPLNLKIATAEALTREDLPFEGQQGVIQALVNDDPAKKIASLVSKLTGKKIQIPRGYEKRTGEEFAREQQTFAYQFREKVWPVIRLSALIALAVGFLGFVGYRYIYQPLYAAGLYDQGLENIEANQYPRANLLFDRAFSIWPDEGRFIQYAQGFAESRQYRLAQEKYQQAIQYNPENRGAILEYSDFAAYTLRDYQESIDTLNILLNKNKNDFDPLLAYGDVHMEWARYTQEPALKTSLYDEARFAYVRLTNMYGQTDELLYRLMLYFVRTDNLPGAFELHKVFELDPRATVEPKIFAELGGFYIDRHLSGERNPFDSGDITTEERLLLTLPDLLEEAQRVLQAAIEQNPRLPEAHYNLARVFSEQGRYDQELRALRSAEILYREQRENRPPTQFEAAQEIDTYTRLGESYRRTRNNLSAEEAYRRAASLYEQARDNNWVSPHHDYGRIYANLADLYYYEGNDYSAALEFYQQAKVNGYGQANRPEMSLLLRGLNYKIGFIHYVQEDFDKAIEAFNDAEGPSLTRNNNLMYAKANSLYQQGNYPPAAALYQILASRLVQERERISAFLVEEDSSHRGLIDFTIRVYNNLGATLHQLAIMAGPDRTRRQVEAQYYFSKATELSENLNRDLETAVRADTRSVAYLNLRSVLVPGFEDQVLLDPDLRKDLESDVF